MFKSKVEVDQHVKNCLKKISSENERNNKSYNFAKLYYSVGAYEETKCYVNAYLSVKPKSAEGHYLLGLTLEKLGRRDAAIEAYKMSLQHNPKQNNLVLKVCELLVDDDVNLDVVGAKYFCQLAENIDPNNPSIYNLKEKLILNEEQNPDGVINLLLKELESRPSDMNIRIRLLRNFVQNNKIHEAYKHVHDTEDRNLPSFSNLCTWYEAVADVLIRYKRQSPPGNLNGQFWCLFISVLDKVMQHKLDENSDNIKESSDYIAHLFLFDQSLYEVCENIEDWPDRLLYSEFVNHYRAQLFLHLAVTIFKQAKKDLMQFKEAASITLPLLFAAYHSKPVDMRGTWINHLQETQRQLVYRWHQEASFRCSQAGHTLLAAANERKSAVIAKATQHSSGMWQELLFKKVFVVREQQLKMNTSYFVSNNVHVNLKLPDKLELLSFDEESFKILPYSLHHYVWVSLNNHLSELKYIPFLGLQYSVKNLGNCGAETLSQLDVQAFVYCATICAQSHLKRLRHMMFYNVDRPNVLPEAVTGQLVSVEQAKFLMAAYRMYKNERDFKCGDIRLILIRGIECVRCVGRHGLDVALLVKLACIFAEKANKSTKTSEIEFNDARAELYWKTALPLLEKMKNNQTIIYSSCRIFEYKTKEMSLTEICKQIENGRLYLGILAMKRKENEKALNIFEELKDPYASFYQAQIYKQMAEHQMSQNKESVTSEMRSQNIILLSKARDCFYLTLDRLREPSIDKDHSLNVELGSEIEKIERLLSRIDSDGDNRNECEGMSDENVSLGDSMDHYTSANYTNQFSNIYSSPYMSRNETRIGQSTPLRVNMPRKEARPSPERLDAQIRQIVATKDTAMKQVLEQNKTMLESHKCLVDELRSFKDAVYNLSSQVDDLKTMKSGLDELKGVKQSVDELKKSVDELQNFRNVVDMVYELKKEIGDIRKDRGKQHQQTCDDLYGLDDDYPDYNVGGNANFGQNYPTRIPPPPPGPLYPHLYPNIYGQMPPYCYPNLGLSQSALSFGAEQQFPPDLRGLVNPLASNPLYPSQSLVQPPTIPPPMGLTTPCINPPLVPSQTSTQANIFRDTRQTTPVASTSATSFGSTVGSVVTSTKSAPVNVVITSSDPLPTPQSTSQPVLSVTIPAQHIKGNVNKSQPHNYQIPLPTTAATSPPSVLSKSPPSLTLEGMLSNVGSPLFSAISDTKANSKNLGLQIEKSLEETFSKSGVNLSKKAVPSDIPNEITLFECPAKLNVVVGDSKELIDRGTGLFKLIESKVENKFKILMKQDTGKIIANHYVVEDMKITSKDNAFYWDAVDYSEGKQSKETMCVQFKNADDAERFHEAFEKLKDKVKRVEIKFQGESHKTIEKSQSNSSQTSNTFGGFIFTSSPIFKPKEEDLTRVTTETVVEKKVDSPFASFSFGPANKSGVSNNNPSLLSNMSPTSPKVEISSPVTPKNADISLAEEFVPTAEFQPVIPLPDMVEVKTGEEGAEELFNFRAKLLRYDSEKKEWKERGLGNMKILKEKTVIRLLMRREVIHKVCCNHLLLKNMNFKYMPNNLKVLTWCAQDFADEMLKTETFAIRFKTEELTNNFLKCILKAQSLLDDDNSIEIEEKFKEEPPVIENKQGFGDKFKPAKGSWECKNCYITNDSKLNNCAACETSRHSANKNDQVFPANPKEPQLESKSISASAPQGNWGDAFKPKAGTWECQSCMVRNESNVLYCISCESPKDKSVPKKESSDTIKGINLDSSFKFSFGIGATSTINDAVPTKQETSTFKFGSSAPAVPTGFSFGNTTFTFQPAAACKPETTKATSDSFVFGSPVAHEFEFKPRSPRQSMGIGDEESDGSFLEEEADNIYFKPVVPLPDKVDVKTGEENEEALYCHRAKLFRFVDGEWKERGTGDLKILKNKNNNKIRVLMRREQILKVCLNHALTSNVKYKPKEDKAWLFAAADFSEGEVSHDKFCLRFKTADIAKGFKDAVTKALQETIVSEKEDGSGSNVDSEVEFISETIVSPEDAKEAERLKLPAKFFAYRQLPLCKCEQCLKDDVYFKGTCLDGSISLENTSSVWNEAISDKTKVSSPLVKSSSFTFVTPKTEVKQTTGDNSSLKNFSFTAKIAEMSGSSTSKPPFDFSASILSMSEEDNRSSIFGSGATTPKTLFPTSANLFGVKSTTFGDSTTVKSGSNIFNTTTPSNIFACKTPITPTSTSDLFATNETTNGIHAVTTPSIFGNNTTVSTSLAGSVFNSSLFGTSTTASSNFFGKNPVSTSLFGANAKPEPTANPFGHVNAGSLFGSNFNSTFGTTTAKFEFGKGDTIFGQSKNNANAATKTSDLKEEDDVVLKCSSEISFASLAKSNSSVAPEFGKATNNGDQMRPFSFCNSGAPVFSSKHKLKEDFSSNSNTSNGQSAKGDDENADDNYDPHYEPIIEMPDAIEVSTGEEDETPVFNERAKLFRYDVELKEWKERGVGQMKILHHPLKGTYRLLLRREQVHKVVLNQLITPNLELQPMSTCEKAWVWAGHNFVDNQSCLEKLAVRFKDQQKAQTFFDSVKSCLSTINVKQNPEPEQNPEPKQNPDPEQNPAPKQNPEPKQNPNPKQNQDPLPTTIENYEVEKPTQDYDQAYSNNSSDSEEDDDLYEEDYDEERSMFSNSCTLYELAPNGEWAELCPGTIQVYYCPEGYCSKIKFMNQYGDEISNSVIGMNTEMKLKENECMWKTVELANKGEMYWRELRAVFDSTEIATEFHASYLEGISYAQEWEIYDDIQNPDMEPSE